jgi:hypothetical protein
MLRQQHDFKECILSGENARTAGPPLPWGNGDIFLATGGQRLDSPSGTPLF